MIASGIDLATPDGAVKTFRCGENIAPAEIEEVLLGHPAVAKAWLVGLPDGEWGQRLAAAIVFRPRLQAAVEELRNFVHSSFRGSKTPESIVLRDHLPHTDTGKLLRRQVRDELAGSATH